MSHMTWVSGDNGRAAPPAEAKGRSPLRPPSVGRSASLAGGQHIARPNAASTSARAPERRRPGGVRSASHDTPQTRPARPSSRRGFCCRGRYRQSGRVCASLIAGRAPSARHLNTLAPPGSPWWGFSFIGRPAALNSPRGHGALEAASGSVEGHARLAKVRDCTLTGRRTERTQGCPQPA